MSNLVTAKKILKLQSSSCILIQVVVGEVDSLVMLWNIETGEDIFTFSDTHR
jgi:hypothetical protein